MASDKQALAVKISPTAERDLKRIWRYNAESRTERHADDYMAFLTKEIFKLSSNYNRGKILQVDPSLRFIVMKRRAGGEGHIAIYQIVESAVKVLHVFHTRQDWQSEYE